MIDFLLQRRVSQLEKDAKSRIALILQKGNGDSVLNLDNLCFIGSCKVNGITLEHTNFLRCVFYRELDDLYPNKLINVTSGISHRRWLVKANPQLSNLLTNALGGED